MGGGPSSPERTQSSPPPPGTSSLASAGLGSEPTENGPPAPAATPHPHLLNSARPLGTARQVTDSLAHAPYATAPFVTSCLITRAPEDNAAARGPEVCRESRGRLLPAAGAHIMSPDGTATPRLSSCPSSLPGRPGVQTSGSCRATGHLQASPQSGAERGLGLLWVRPMQAKPEKMGLGDARS